ncbi:C40 family peptidase [Streptomyces clavuligerus]|uniref:NLP/P60-family secreted protein n=1 Tax=Streptomyces clavuligerus TaxID=1901 RepID=B5GP34_STRCL|nr:C40 family peptidase [Streptomyces clavuligerus]ANW19004.1 glycoside hydrolase [Streptomyces clavuligerus]AXU13586.1 glycoside hydrolase [Streptomyces clavuligerus]EDY48080.1 NLP/P60-family secreted protein [Streptomyces clavuligerus]EFG08282.1 NLP/P60-family secreted protein [Streptomyces clavuligerus]MBY6303544.1 C40 family peptidase [Streptomyces clavuligerus]
MLRRHCATGAITVVCALAVLAVPGTAFAAVPAEPGRALPRVLPRAPEPPVAPERPAPGDALERVRLDMEKLYQQAASATDAYNLAEERTEQQSAEIVRLARRIDGGRTRIAELKDRAGAAAREQYRGGGLPAGAQLLLTDDPRLFLDAAERVRQSMKATKDLLTELERAQRELEDYTRRASAEWRDLEADRQAQKKAKKRITERIAAAQRLESRLAEEERERLLALEREAAERAQEAWLREQALKQRQNAGDGPGGGSRADAPGRARGSEAGPAGAAAKAIAFALAQVGKPYAWGAEGPGSFDCSGLTSQAWAAGGVGIPRTSQQQWRELPRVATEDIQPGDLIVYNADASHIGIYIGDGRIVHSPRPGRTVSVAGAGSMKILGVVRPDPA